MGATAVPLERDTGDGRAEVGDFVVFCVVAFDGVSAPSAIVTSPAKSCVREMYTKVPTGASGAIEIVKLSPGRI